MSARSAAPDLRAELDAIAATGTRRGPDCVTCSLPPELLDALRYGRGTRKLSFSQLEGYLKGKGHNITEPSLARHFRRHEPARG